MLLVVITNGLDVYLALFGVELLGPMLKSLRSHFNSYNTESVWRTLNENNISFRNLDYTNYIVFHSNLNLWFGWPVHCAKSKLDLLLVLSVLSYNKYFTYISSRLEVGILLSMIDSDMYHISQHCNQIKKYNIAYTGCIVKIKYYYIKFGHPNKYDYYNRMERAC